MARPPQLLDQWGRPIERKVLTEDVAGPTITGVRSPLTGYPADALNPMRLATILREADAGDPLRYLELAETIEERDLHYAGVLGTRKRSVAQIEISVDAASDDPADVEKADLIRDWLLRDELADELFDILDAVGKGYSFTEIIWDTSEGQWQPKRLEWRDPRWFRPARHDLTTPLMIGENGEELPLSGGKFITAVMRAKSGIPVRSGIARIVSWAWMFKAFTNRDWAIFTQTFGQPIRVGKYHSNASQAERDTLYRAVANIAGDCAAIIPDGMLIEFIESKSVGSSMELYEKRADWLDRQISKAVLGQTTTTDAVSGGHAVSQEHRQVQEDIERADARALSAILNRDLIRVWIDLEYGPQKRYPRLRIARPDEEDLSQLSSSLAQLVPLGLRVQASEVRDKFGLSDPEDGAEVLSAPAVATAAAPPQQTELQAKRPAAKPEPPELLAETLDREALPAMHDIMEKIEAMLSAASDLDEFREMLRTAFPKLDSNALGQTLALGMVAAQAAGRYLVEEGE